MRKPTKKELEQFRVACEMLNELGEKGFGIYLANDSMNLMIGPTHDESTRNLRPLQHNSAASHTIWGSGGGDW